MAVRQESIGRLDLDGVAVVCLFYLGDKVRIHTRYVARRLRRLKSDLTIIACNLNDSAARETAETLHADQVTADFDRAIVEIAGRLGLDTEAEKATAAQTAFAGAGRGDDALGRALEEIAEKLGVPLATINLIDDERHRDDADAFRLTQTITSSGEPLVIHMGSASDGLEANSYLLSNGVELYAGVPLTLASGETVGTLAVMDYDPHEFGDADVDKLKACAADLVARFGNTPAPAGRTAPREPTAPTPPQTAPVP
jgi:GAF domain-containing protein